MFLSHVSSSLDNRGLTPLQRLSQCFKRGRHGMFDDVPARLSLRQRHYLPLFLAVVQQRVVVDLTVRVWHGKLCALVANML